ncbi:hypothetical protein Efla_007236 [Eimeria flavescens]
MKQTKRIEEPATAADCCSNSLSSAAARPQLRLCFARSRLKLVHQQQQQQQQNQWQQQQQQRQHSAAFGGLVRLACQRSRRSPLPPPQQQGKQQSREQGISSRFPPQQQGKQQSREQGSLLGLSYSCEHQLANGLKPVELRRGVPRLLGCGPWDSDCGGHLPLQQLEAESSDRAAAVAVAAESAGERPAAAAAAAAAGSPHRGPAL